MQVSGFGDRWDDLPQDGNPFGELVLDDLHDGPSEKRSVDAQLPTDAIGIKTYKTVWTMGHKIRKAMADRDSQYQLAGLVEMDDAFIGPKKPGPPGRGA